MINKLSDLIDKAKKNETCYIAVASAEDEAVLQSIKDAYEKEIATPILIGNEQKIKEVAESINFNLSNILIIHTDEGADVASKMAVALVKAGEANILMKGFVSTASLMRAVLNKEDGLRKGGTLSHVAFFESPYYHKLLCITDVAMNIAPDFDTKVHILNNAVDACQRIGITKPKAAIVAAVETIDNKMEATIHAGLLKVMNQRNQIKGCIVDGPLALDNAINKEAAIHKGISSEVAGDCDIILVPNIEAGNILYKSLNFLGGASSAAIIMGATVPIVLTSRSDSEKSKLLSIALAASMI